MLDKYLDSVNEYSVDHDKGEIAEHFGLSAETVNRYLRAICQYHRGDVVPKRFPNMLVVDIETAPIKAYTWGLWKQNIQPQQIIQDWFIIGWAAKWLFSDEVYTGYVTPAMAKKGNDKDIMKDLWNLLDKADMAIAHNAKRFDIPRINTRLLLNGHMPPAPYQVIDTLYYYKKQFAISSNRLDYINQMMMLPRKMDTGGFKLWDSCLKGDKEALDTMKTYNINDVYILEENYLKVRPWIMNHPNVGVYMDNDKLTCSNCGSTNLKKATTDYVTPVNRYVTHRCLGCGGIAGRERTSKLGKDSMSHVLRGQAR